MALRSCVFLGIVIQKEMRFMVLPRLSFSVRDLARGEASPRVQDLARRVDEALSQAKESERDGDPPGVPLPPISSLSSSRSLRDALDL